MADISIEQNNSGKWDSVQFAAVPGGLIGFHPTTGAPQVATGLSFDASGNLGVGAHYVEGAIMTAPAAPAAGGFRIFAKDTGGKVELLVIFPSGAAQQLAIEP